MKVVVKITDSFRNLIKKMWVKYSSKVSKVYIKVLLLNYGFMLKSLSLLILHIYMLSMIYQTKMKSLK
jgi:hypothetical protein